MNEIMNFKFENDENLKCVEINGELLFEPHSIGNCLGLPKKTVQDYLSKMDSEDKVFIEQKDMISNRDQNFPSGGRTFLRESGMYLFIFKSRKKEAKAFKKWVAREVLPSIRKTGKFELKQQVERLDVVELETLINTCEDLKIAKAPELSNINKQSARMKLGIVISTLSHERQIGTKALYEQLYYRYAEQTGTFIPIEASNSGKTRSEYLKDHALLSEKLYDFALVYFYQGKSVVELFNWDSNQKTLAEF